MHVSIALLAAARTLVFSQNTLSRSVITNLCIAFRSARACDDSLKKTGPALASRAFVKAGKQKQKLEAALYYMPPMLPPLPPSSSVDDVSWERMPSAMARTF